MLGDGGNVSLGGIGSPRLSIAASAIHVTP
jgi:hypothetical protein